MMCVYRSFALFMCILGHVHGAERVAVRDLLHQHATRKRQLTPEEQAVTSYLLHKEASHLTRRELDDVMGLDDDTSLSEVTSQTSAQGTRITKERETYKGVLVPDGMVTIETDNEGHVLDVSGHVFRDINLGLKNALSQEEAVSICQRYHDDQDFSEDISHVKAELQIQFEEDGTGDNDVTPYPAYLVQYLVLSEGDQRRPSCIVSAIDGTVRVSWDALDTYSDCCGAEGIGGNLKIGPIQYGRLQRCLEVEQKGDRCYLHNRYIRVVHNNFTENGADEEQVASYDCKDPEDAINGAFSPLLDALFYGTVVARMYEDWYNYDLKPLTLPLTFRVHYGVNVSNAFWNGDSCMYGDGDEEMHPLVILDVVGHEIAHGVTEVNSNLYYYNQWGALNEAFSDIAGVAAEAYIGVANWLLGFEVSKTDRPIRYMNNPEADNHSISHTDNFTSNLDVHLSSGIYNKAFFIIVEDFGLSIKDVFHVFLHANRLYWHNMPTFKGAACDVLKAAYDLGQNGKAFREAFSEVGVDLEGCDVNNHVVGLRHNTWRHNITVSKTVSPFFALGVPAMISANYSIYANSSEGDVIITVSNKNWSGKQDCELIIFARGINIVEVEIPANSSDYHVSVELSTYSLKVLSDVSVMATFGCLADFDENTDGFYLWWWYCESERSKTTFAPETDNTTTTKPGC